MNNKPILKSFLMAKNQPIKSPQNKKQKGAVLLEAMIAVLIFSMGILAISGLQGAMVKNTTDAKYRADASFIAQQAIGRIWADPENLSNYAEASPGTDISTLLPNGRRIVEIPADGQVRVEITWQVPGEDANRYAVAGRVTVNSPI
jgi:type IV pilus assembly protein PilV